MRTNLFVVFVVFLALIPASAGALDDQHNLCSTTPNMGVINLPIDEGAHVGQFAELWFQYGHLFAFPSGKEFGFVTYFFQFDFTALGFGAFSYQIVSITDMDTGGYQHEAYLYYSLAAPLVNAFDITNPNNGWRFKGSNGQTELHLSLGAESDPNDYVLHLWSSTLKDPIAQWHDGFMDFGVSPVIGPRGQQKLYSRTRLSSFGTMKINGQTQIVVGEGWYEKQFGGYNDVAGRPWIGIMLDNGVEISAAEYTGLILGDYIDRVGSVAYPPSSCGRREIIAENLLITSSFSPGFYSSVTDSLYPDYFEVEIPDENIHLIIEPVSLQEIYDLEGLPFAPIEQGASRVSGLYHGQPVSGFAYAEFSQFLEIP